jgi:hypothetical protein
VLGVVVDWKLISAVEFLGKKGTGISNRFSGKFSEWSWESGMLVKKGLEMGQGGWGPLNVWRESNHRIMT